jgi:hypothetical protein
VRPRTTDSWIITAAIEPETAPKDPERAPEETLGNRGIILIPVSAPYKGRSS